MKSQQMYVLLGACFCVLFVLIATRTHGTIRSRIACPRGGFCEGDGSRKTSSNSGSVSVSHTPNSDSQVSNANIAVESSDPMQYGGTAPSAETDNDPMTYGGTAPSNSAPSAEAPSPAAPTPPPPTPPPSTPPPSTPPPSKPPSEDPNAVKVVVVETKAEVEHEEYVAIERDIEGRLHNPYLKQYLSHDLENLWLKLEKERVEQKKFIQTNFGTWCGTVDGFNCWIETGKNTGSFKLFPTCLCKESHWSNQTNWDVNWRKTCDKQNKELESKFPFPEPLREVMDLNFKTQGLNKYGSLNPYFAQPFGSGTRNTAPLDFNVVTVRNHFQKLRAGLVLYYHGISRVETIEPKPGHSQYTEHIQALADRMAGAIIRKDSTVVVGVLGDSTAAGMDNCFFDAWPNGLWRQFRPLFNAMSIDFEVRDAGHNGGKATNPQMACAESFLGADVDFAILSAPFVHPGKWAYEDFIRRSLISGALPSVHLESEGALVDKYGKFGFSSNLNTNRMAAEIGVAEQGYKWYPSQGKSNWGRIDDGLCHAAQTRSGSAAVHTRNWHPGPLGHEYTQDRIAFVYADAVIKALDEIADALIKSNNDIKPLLKKWPRRTTVTAAQLGDSIACADAAWATTNAGKQACGPNAPQNFGYAHCLTSLDPHHGATWEDWIVDPAKVVWEGSDNGKVDTYSKAGPYSKGNFYTCASRSCDLEENPKENCAKGCTEQMQSRAFTFETVRNDRECVHNDTETFLDMNGGWTTFEVPANTMKAGVISLCTACGASTRVMIQGSAVAKQEIKGADWTGSDDFGSKKCATIKRDVPKAALSQPFYIGIKCDLAGKKLEYLVVQ